VQFPSRRHSETRRSLCLGALLSLLQSACGRRDEKAASLSPPVLPEVSLARLDSGQPQALGPGIGPCLINFWATWCPPCRAEMASLGRLHRAYAARGFQVFAVSVDRDTHLVREYLVGTPLDFPVLLDPQGIVSERAFQVRMFPTSWLVDARSLVRDVWIGERDWDEAVNRAAIEALLRAS